MIDPNAFVVGQYKAPGVDDNGTVWEFQGVFSTRLRAEAACRTDAYFVIEAQIDEPLPHGTMPQDGRDYYPRQGGTRCGP